MSSRLPGFQKTFIVAVAVLTLCTLVAFRIGFNNRTRACLDTPRAGDLYMARISALRPGAEVVAEYALLRVEEVHRDRVIARASTVRSPSKRRVYRQLDETVRRSDAFTPADAFALPRDDLHVLHERGVILVARHLES